MSNILIKKEKASAFVSYGLVTSRSVVLFWLVDWLLGSMQERNRFYVQSEGGGTC
jgi:hypothetical protein